MNKFTITALSAVFLLATNVSAETLSKTEYKAAKDQISATYKSDKSACQSLAGNAKDICIEGAKGHENVALAELKAKNEPSEKNNYKVRLAKADAAYAVAKENCDDLSGNPKDVCRKQAKSAYVTAKANAKLAEKTADANAVAQEKKADANAVASEKTNEARKDANTDKRDAAYAVAKEKCDSFAGPTKDNCLKEAKTRYGQ